MCDVKVEQCKEHNFWYKEWKHRGNDITILLDENKFLKEEIERLRQLNYDLINQKYRSKENIELLVQNILNELEN